MDLVTLAETKTELGISSSEHDALLTILIDRVSLTIEKYVGYAFDEEEKTQYEDGDSIDYFTLLPTIDNDSIVVNDRIEDEDLEIDLIDGRHILLLYEAPTGDKRIKITYDFGYDDVANIPQDIKGVAISWINAKLQENLSEAITQQVTKSEKIEDISITYFTPAELQKAGVGGVDDYGILDNYRIKQYV